jgi:RNA polymerase sigma-70 factor (ECF subfamily)
LIENEDKVKILIRHCRKNKIVYQEKLYRYYYGYVFSICSRYSNSKEETFEMLNDSFLKVFSKINKFDDKQKFKPWLRKVTINASIDYFRKYKDYKNALSIESYEIGQDDGAIFGKLNADDIISIMGELPDIFRLIFNLYEIDGYSHKEISEKLKIPEGTSRSYLTRAKEKMRDLIHKYNKQDYERAV